MLVMNPHQNQKETIEKNHMELLSSERRLSVRSRRRSKSPKKQGSSGEHDHEKHTTDASKRRESKIKKNIKKKDKRDSPRREDEERGEPLLFSHHSPKFLQQVFDDVVSDFQKTKGTSAPKRRARSQSVGAATFSTMADEEESFRSISPKTTVSAEAASGRRRRAFSLSLQSPLPPHSFHGVVRPKTPRYDDDDDEPTTPIPTPYLIPGGNTATPTKRASFRVNSPCRDMTIFQLLPSPSAARNGGATPVSFASRSSHTTMSSSWATGMESSSYSSSSSYSLSSRSSSLMRRRQSSSQGQGPAILLTPPPGSKKSHHDLLGASLLDHLLTVTTPTGDGSVRYDYDDGTSIDEEVQTRLGQVLSLGQRRPSLRKEPGGESHRTTSPSTLLHSPPRLALSPYKDENDQDVFLFSSGPGVGGGASSTMPGEAAVTRSPQPVRQREQALPYKKSPARTKATEEDSEDDRIPLLDEEDHDDEQEENDHNNKMRKKSSKSNKHEKKSKKAIKTSKAKKKRRSPRGNNKEGEAHKEEESRRRPLDKELLSLQQRLHSEQEELRKKQRKALRSLRRLSSKEIQNDAGDATITNNTKNTSSEEENDE